MPFKNAPSFRCRNCGHLEGGDHAGEHAKPHACSACSAGVTFTPQGIKIAQPDNWDVLSEMSEEQLAEYGLKPDEVAKHVPHPKGGSGRDPRSVSVEASDGANSKDEA